MDTHLKLHVTQLKQLTQAQAYPLHDQNADFDSPRNIKAIIYHNNDFTNILISKPDTTPESIEETSSTFALPLPHITSILEKQQRY